MTLTDKILARAAGKARVEAGENVWVQTDVLMTHDVCGPGTIGVFKREFGNDAKVWDQNKVVIIPDHYIFTADSKSNRNVDILREFVREQGITSSPAGYGYVGGYRYGAYGAYGGVRSVYSPRAEARGISQERRVVRSEEKGNMAVNVQQIRDAMIAATADIRRKMTQKYEVEF